MKEEALDRTMWRNRFGRGFGPVVSQITDDDDDELEMSLVSSRIKKKLLTNISVQESSSFNPLNAEINSMCYLLVLLAAHHILHVSRLRVKILIALFIQLGDIKTQNMSTKQ